MPGRSARRDELEGLHTGITQRLAARGTPTPAEIARLLSEGETALREGDLEVAEARLVEVDRRLDLEEEEMELTEFPRGLVGYEAKGSRGIPPGREEDQLGNRLVLVERLLTVRRSQGRDVDALARRLHEAEAAYSAGDRARARRLCDEVHSVLESMEPGEPGSTQA